MHYMKMLINKSDRSSKGNGFCFYNDRDNAITAIRKLNKTMVGNREIKVHYGNATNTYNLKKEDVIARDNGEIISTDDGTVLASQGMGTVLKP